MVFNGLNLINQNKFDFHVTVGGDYMYQDFIEGYCDGHDQAIENLRYNLLEFLKEHNELTFDDVNRICNCCSKVDMNYLNQWMNDLLGRLEEVI